MSENQRAIKILVVIDSMGLGGAQSLIIDFCAGYDRQCLDVLVCALGKRTDMAERLEQHDAAYRILKIAKWNPFCGRKLRQVAEQFKPDIIYAHLIKSLIAGSMLAHHIGVPLVFHEHHEATLANVRDAAGAGERLAKALYTFKRHFTYQANRIITHGPRIADRMLALNLVKAEQVFVIPHGIDLSRFVFSDEQRADLRRQIRQEFSIPEDATVVCKVGRFAEVKNWPDFLRVFADAAGSHPDMRAFAVGDGPLLGDMKALAQELGVADRAIFTGFRSDVPHLFLASDAMVYTSRAESGPLVVEEAMACGVPVFTYDVGETRSMVREGIDGHVVENGDAARLGEHLRAALADPAKLSAYSESCRERAFTEFDVRLMVRRMELVLANARIKHARPRILGH